jgi:hypothetical protein
MKIVSLIILSICLVLPILPIAGQVYFGKKKLKGQLTFQFYGINISAILAEIILCYVSTSIIMSGPMRHLLGEKLCVLGMMCVYAIGVLGVPLVQPLIALYFYIKTTSPTET